MRELFRELGVLMERLWEDPAVQLAYSRSVDYRGVQLTYSKIIQYWAVQLTYSRTLDKGSPAHLQYSRSVQD
jgi:hypothetical protein